MDKNTQTETTATESTLTKRAPKGPGIKMADVVAILADKPASVSYELKAHFAKLTGPGGASMYIALRDEVRQIDLSGWGEDEEGCRAPKRPNGNVRAQLDLSSPDALKHLARLVARLATVQATKKGRSSKGGRDSRAAALRALQVLGQPSTPATSAPEPEEAVLEQQLAEDEADDESTETV
jgi:hypothetical protein